MTKNKAPDMSGMAFGRWTVLSRAPSSKRGLAQWLCRCVCNKESIVRGSQLRDGSSLSCGCLAAERAMAANRTHGLYQSPTYSTWVNMLQRCTNPNNNNYRKYGARGITVCKRWLSFDNFLEDMGIRPTDKTLDRKNGLLGYSKSNCRWATVQEQNQNTRRNTLTKEMVVEIRKLYSEGTTRAKIAREYGVDYQAVDAAVSGRTWSNVPA